LRRPGGGIASENGTLAVWGSVINDNVSGSGGGIFFSGGGTLTVTNTVINNNGPCDPGGGIYADGATVTVSDSSITANTGILGGGIFYNNTQLTVMNSTISGNSVVANPIGVAEGGGVYNQVGTLTVTNSTISGNDASAGTDGGGVANYVTLTMTNSTMSGNVAPTAGSTFNGNGGAAQVGDTILNAGAPGGTISNQGTLTSLGYNPASDNGGGVLTGPGDQINTDPMLGPLQDNGGRTFTHALLPGSPAIEVGDPNFTPPPFYDQRGPGFARVVNGRIDKGSFEVQPRPTPTPRPRPTPAPRPTP